MHISKEGDPYLRTLLVQGAHHILGPFGADSDLRRWGLKLGAWREEWQETSGDCDGAKASGLAASLVGEWRGLRTAAQQPTDPVAGSRISTVSWNRKHKAQAPSSGDCVNGLAQLPSRDGREVD